MNDLPTHRLRQLDAKRLNIRDTYKQEMHSATRPAVPGVKITFPKSHLSEGDTLLRNGLSWHYNGFIIEVGEATIVVDPGVDFLYRLQKSDINPSLITHIYISHAHIDHYAGANSLMDWLIRAQKEVQLIAPESVFANKVVSDFHSARAAFPEGWKPLHSSISVTAGEEVQIADGIQLVPIQLHHGIECLGFRLRTQYGDITYISDTGYAISFEESGKLIVTKFKQIPTVDRPQYMDWHKDLDETIKNSKILIANIDSYYPTKNSPTHLSILDLEHMLVDNNSGIEKVILGHINPVGELLFDEWAATLAADVELQTGISTVAPDVAGLEIQLN